jgi:hypothetical protein
MRRDAANLVISVCGQGGGRAADVSDEQYQLIDASSSILDHTHTTVAAALVFAVAKAQAHDREHAVRLPPLAPHRGPTRAAASAARLCADPRHSALPARAAPARPLDVLLRACEGDPSGRRTLQRPVAADVAVQGHLLCHLRLQSRPCRNWGHQSLKSPSGSVVSV